MSELKNQPQHLSIPETVNDSNEAQRLFHGRGHRFSGLEYVNIDWLPPVILITLYQPEDQQQIRKLADILLKLLPECRSIQLQFRYLRDGPVQLVSGEAIQTLTIQEQGLQFRINLGRARNSGLFLDMRNGRQWVKQHSQGNRVLNLFAYTCGFSVAAVAGQARSVLNVDMSSAALSIGRENHRLNNQALGCVQFQKLDIFKSFGRIKKRGPFDLMICDPPTFQKGSVDIVKDYPKIIRRLPDLMAPSASLLLCMNSPHHGPELINDCMKSLAPDYRYIEEVETPAVFKDAQGRGVKALYFKHSVTQI